MMEAVASPKVTAEQYLQLERQARVRSEYFDGEIFAMAGGTEAHSLLGANLIAELQNRLKSEPCKVYTSDMRLKIEATGLYTYPDVQVACGGSRFEDARRDTLLNPQIIIEVLSESTAAWDRGEKFWHYRHLPSLKEYVLVSQDARVVEHYERQPDGTWVLQSVQGPTGVLSLRSIRATIPLAEIYARTEINPEIRPGLQRPHPKPDRET